MLLCRGRIAAAFVLVILSVASLAAQTATGRNPIVEAERLRAAGDFENAVRLLRDVLTRQPDNGDAARLLAQTLYWLHDVRGAQEVYERALLRHREDTALRLQYGRMLVETAQRARATTLLTPLLTSPSTRVEAGALLGTLAYAEGDLTTAARRFAEVLAISPRHLDAAHQLLEIRSMTRSWIRAGSSLRSDDQPLDRTDLTVEAGAFVTPLVPVSVRVERFGFDGPGAEGRRGLSLRGSVGSFFPRSRIETTVTGGLLQRTKLGNPWNWHGQAAVGARLSRQATLGARLERSAYFHTLSSLATPVMVRSATAFLRANAPTGWLAEAAVQRQRYPDANWLWTTYGWVLAPLVRRSPTEVQVGYAFGTGHARDSRFALEAPVQAFPPGDPRFDTTGRYDPYYTPSHLVTHSAIAALSVRRNARATIRANGAYGVRATDDAPVFVVSGAQVERFTYPRTFHPWNARGSLTLALADGVALDAAAEIGRTAFYTWMTADVQVTYRFGDRSARETR